MFKMKNFSQLSVLSLLISFFVVGSATAHVVVRPAEVKTSSFTTFSIGVPNEREVPTTEVKILIPEGLQYVTPTVKSGWVITTEKASHDDNESADEGHSESKVVSISWSGGQILDGFRDEFSFSAKVPDNAAEIEWKAYQTNADGVVVAWDQPETDETEEKENSGPFSVTKVVTETETRVEINRAQAAAADSDKAADQALYVAIVAAVIGIVGIALALRKK